MRTASRTALSFSSSTGLSEYLRTLLRVLIASKRSILPPCVAPGKPGTKKYSLRRLEDTNKIPGLSTLVPSGLSMFFDFLEDPVHARPRGGGGKDNRRGPSVEKQRDGVLQGPHGAGRAFQIALAHEKDIADLHDPGLHHLNVIAEARRDDHDHRMNGPLHLGFTLAHARRLEKDRVHAEGVQDTGGVRCRPREPPRPLPGRHAPDKDPAVPGMLLHSDPVA